MYRKTDAPWCRFMRRDHRRKRWNSRPKRCRQVLLEDSRSIVDLSQSKGGLTQIGIYVNQNFLSNLISGDTLLDASQACVTRTRRYTARQFRSRAVEHTRHIEIEKPEILCRYQTVLHRPQGCSQACCARTRRSHPRKRYPCTDIRFRFLTLTCACTSAIPVCKLFKNASAHTKISHHYCTCTDTRVRWRV